MKLYVFKINSILKSIFLIIAIIVLVVVFFYSRQEVLTVFQTKRDLPIYSVDCPDKKIAITFDCAWGSDDIPDILKILESHDVRATFFIVGTWAEKFPEAVRMIFEAGHDVANHSYSHIKMGNIDKSRVKDEILKCDTVLEKITGKEVNLFRAPYGEYNNNVVRAARELNYYTIQWDVDSLDWKPGITPEKIHERINNNIKNGSILLFHNDTAHTVATISDIIVNLKNNGYIFVPVSELIIKDSYYIDNTGKQRKNKSDNL
ncbi:polysaccharide deacetylase family protein [Herbivorax sp. ANBcel31]|uniref:polysaccharide deacetylase family protein n=1 Tax=Herbivorax sp. ANBcel31 TaxID=3069754 RepID=UPI0027AF2496|nr:polysaccharide deacetylase family protein [Herbivorax sp. ANBcel31]MDQ2087143.1 polysaccharide deacetylase family protein [Herbivorax sp. ANBcel31]